MSSKHAIQILIDWDMSGMKSDFARRAELHRILLCAVGRVYEHIDATSDSEDIRDERGSVVGKVIVET